MLYIHQFPDWTNFRYDAKRVLDALGTTRLVEGKLLGLSQLCEIRQLEMESLTDDIVANFSIDGHKLHEEQVRKELELRGKGSQNYIKNHLGALQNSATSLTFERLCNWHAAMSQNKSLQFRNEDSQVAFDAESVKLLFTGPNPERIPSEMEHFVKWFETSPLDGVIKAAVAQFWILTIRPFREANGRVARTVTAMQLARAEKSTRCLYSVNRQINKNKIDYMNILCKTQRSNGDLTEWILWFLNMMERAILESIEKLSVQIKQIILQKQFANVDLSSRERKIVNAVMEKLLPETFSAKDVASFIEASHDTALREIQSLIEKGVLQSNKKRGRSQNYSLVE